MQGNGVSSQFGGSEISQVDSSPFVRYTCCPPPFVSAEGYAGESRGVGSARSTSTRGDRVKVVREIESGELSECCNLGGVVGSRGLFSGVEGSEIVTLGASGPSGSIGVDAPVARAVAMPRPAIRLVLSIRSEPKVAPDIVQAVAISVIDLDTARSIHDESVHLDIAVLAAIGDSASGVPGVVGSGCAPLELTDAVVIGGVNGRHFPLSEGNGHTGHVEHLIRVRPSPRLLAQRGGSACPFYHAQQRCSACAKGLLRLLP